MTDTPPPIRIYVDADACPVKDEVYRVAGRHGLPVFVVTNSFIRVPRDPLIERIAVAAGPDAADDWIAEHVTEDDIVIAGDIPLAARCIEKGAQVLAPTGRRFTPDSIGEALATRNLLSQLRDMGTVTGGPPPFDKKDRSRFLQRLDETIQAALRRK